MNRVEQENRLIKLYCSTRPDERIIENEIKVNINETIYTKQINPIWHYITLFHNAAYTWSGQWCINKVIFVIHRRAWTGDFSVVFLKVYQCSLVPGDWMEVSSTPFGPAYMRNPDHQTWISVLGFRIENCWRSEVSHDQVDRRWLSSCEPAR